jgi:hypothetical protein
MGGVFNLPNLNLYGYAQQNPVRLVDPTGEIPVETVWDVLMAFVGARSLWQDIAARNWSAAALDALGLAWDIGAMALPYIPGGAAIIRNGRQALSQARRLSSQLGDAIQHAPPSLRRTLEGLKSKLDEAIDTASRFFDEAASQRAARQAALGVAREQRVAELIGGQAARRQVVVPGVGSTDIDVIGAAGEFVAVGGPAKAGNLSPPRAPNAGPTRSCSEGGCESHGLF